MWEKVHIVKVCKYRKTVDNIDEKSEDTAEEECNSITSDNESELSVLKISTPGSLSQQNNSIQYNSRLQTTKSFKKLEVNNTNSVIIQSLQATFRVTFSFLKATIDTGSPAPLVKT